MEPCIKEMGVDMKDPGKGTSLMELGHLYMETKSLTSENIGMAIWMDLGEVSTIMVTFTKGTFIRDACREWGFTSMEKIKNGFLLILKITTLQRSLKREPCRIMTKHCLTLKDWKANTRKVLMQTHKP